MSRIPGDFTAVESAYPSARLNRPSVLAGMSKLPLNRKFLVSWTAGVVDVRARHGFSKKNEKHWEVLSSKGRFIAIARGNLMVQRRCGKPCVIGTQADSDVASRT